MFRSQEPGMQAPPPINGEDVGRVIATNDSLILRQGPSGMTSHDAIKLADALNLNRPGKTTPSLGFSGNYMGFDLHGFIQDANSRATADVSWTGTTDAFANRFMGRPMPLQRGDPCGLVRSAILGGRWHRAEVPEGVTRIGLCKLIHSVMMNSRQTIEATAIELAEGRPDDALCAAMKCGPARRDILIALATQEIIDDRLGLAPPGSAVGFVKNLASGFESDQVWLVHGTSTPNITSWRGLWNLRRPHYCIQVDITKVVPGIDRADDMIGVPWATMTLHPAIKESQAMYSVSKPSSGTHKDVALTLTLDPTPSWRYHPEAIKDMLIVICKAVTEKTAAAQKGASNYGS